MLAAHSTNMARIRNFKLRLAALGCVLLGLVTGPLVLATGAAATARGPLAPFPAPTVNFVGFGDGHGHGMGQWGAFGYAAVEHETYQWILAHYYGGTTLSVSKHLVSKDPEISVDLNENDGAPVVVTSPSAFSFGGHSFRGGQVARAVLAAGRWALSEATRCASTKWTHVASGLVNPVAKPFSLLPYARSTQVLTICEADGAHLPVRGTVQAYDSPGGAVTLSILPIEEYVRSVISAEVSWSWGLFGVGKGSPQGHPWGFQALEAQAVASRTYAAAELASGGWTSYATACDAYCQAYTGMANEAPVSNAAVADTAGEILLAGGQPVYAEYSASTGGYSYGGEFPAVVDRGDTVCIKSSYYTCNPCHKWVAAVPVSSVEQAYPSVGTLAAIEVTKRNGLGALGGRAVTVEIIGTGGVKVSVPAYDLESLLGANNPNYCVSDWYGVTNGP
ncbi:MAG TPA: SpoIID/LytB domain-containing protein [Acidimicrobiales bacterium]|nr:SpoIID/LytB domain-containing protein [Acidimicrobiales bacterium]